ncbi:MOSC N-terminal beta barrel domain-containing protein [Streptomyces coacervatus]|uniref:MOSC N-terminal beta barrel domain-containing protein n=1 Tax=Streptomyces coacervatus TaxID=647381 RepID=UPI0023DCE740|nr:MOSC N-terminal beta barrel domain-containing protein [Streptomyces coacervatus]MDF2264826.1 MOSC N-terminal beta barrel domain-containing protein [Streptomyces coacervatus]
MTERQILGGPPQAHSELSYYPVKGCAGVSACETLLTPAGLAHDRSFMVVSEEGVFRSQRRDPAPHTEPLELPVDASGARRQVDLFGTAYQGIDQGDTAAAWLSDVLRARSRPVRVPREHDRVTDGRTPGTSGYADNCAVTLVDQDSGQRAGPEPLRTLAGYRRSAQGGVAFGTKLSVLRTGKIAVGDAVTVTSWGESELPAPHGSLRARVGDH